MVPSAWPQTALALVRCLRRLEVPGVLLPLPEVRVMTDDEILDAIQAIRARSNVLHVSVQRIALEMAPERTKELLREIIANDERITVLSKELAK